MKEFRILDVKINPLTYKEFLDQVFGLIEKKEQGLIATVNAEFVLLAQKDKEFKNIINNSLISTADGAGILWAAKFNSLPLADSWFFRYDQACGYFIFTLLSIIFSPKFLRSVIPEKISGVDLIEQIAASGKPVSFFLLGSRGDVSALAAKKLKDKYPHIEIKGYSNADPDNEEVIRQIAQDPPDILLVAYGQGKQEKWIKETLSSTKATLGIGIGGSLDFLANKAKRAPRFIQSIGLESVWRLVMEPKRIKRILNATVVFPFQVLIARFSQSD